MSQDKADRGQTYTVRRKDTGQSLFRLKPLHEAVALAESYGRFGREAEVIPEAVTIRYADDAEPIDVGDTGAGKFDANGLRIGDDPSKWREQARKAVRLESLARKRLIVEFDSNATTEDDLASSGHIYRVMSTAEYGVDAITLDDRKPESLEAQLAEELRRVSRGYRRLAKLVEAAAR